MEGIGPWEIFALLVVVIVLLLVRRLSEVPRAMGRGGGGRGRKTTPEVAAPVAPAVVVPQVACPTCQAMNSASNHFCSACGATLVPSEPETSEPEPAAPLVENTCPSCATVNPPGQVFCGQCGTRLTPAAA